MAKDKLTGKQQRFAEEYIKDANATQAYKRAGYSVSSDEIAAVEGHKLLRNPKISAYISDIQAEVSEATGVQVKDLVKELAKIAFTNLPDMLEPSSFERGASLEIKDMDQLTEAQRASILEISETKGREGTTRKIKLHSKLTAIDMLMKNLGGYMTAADLIDKLPPERLDQLVEELLQKLNRKDAAHG